jgi:FKBP-type peptidyl-prolyl cis-trans isomerase
MLYVEVISKPEECKRIPHTRRDDRIQIHYTGSYTNLGTTSRFEDSRDTSVGNLGKPFDFTLQANPSVVIMVRQ